MLSHIDSYEDDQEAPNATDSTDGEPAGARWYPMEENSKERVEGNKLQRGNDEGEKRRGQIWMSPECYMLFMSATRSARMVVAF